MRKKVFFALGCVLYLTGCDSFFTRKSHPANKVSPHSIQHSDGKRDSVFSHPQHTE